MDATITENRKATSVRPEAAKQTLTFQNTLENYVWVTKFEEVPNGYFRSS